MTSLAMMDSGFAPLVIPSRNAAVTIYSYSIKANEQSGDATDVAAAKRRKLILEVTKRRLGQLLADRLLTTSALLDPRLGKWNTGKAD